MQRLLDSAQKLSITEKQWHYIESYLYYHPHLSKEDYAFLLEQAKLNAASAQTAPDQAVLHRMCGLLYYELEDISNAQYHLRQALKYYQRNKIGKNYDAFMAHWLMGEVEMVSKEHPERAQQWYELAQNLATSDSLWLFSLASQANYHSLHGDNEKAITIRHTCIEIAEKYNKKFHIAKNQVYLGHYYSILNEEKKSIYYFNAAIPVLKQYTNANLLAQAYSGKANVLLKQKKTQEALVYLDSCLVIADKLTKKSQQIKAWMSAAPVYSNLGKYNTALQLGYKILPELQRNNQDVNFVYVAVGMAIDWLNANKIDSAKVYAEKALPIAAELRLLPDLCDIYDILSQIAFNKKHYQEAFLLKEKYIMYKDSVYQIDKFKKIQELETIYETKIKEKAINDLTNKARIAELASQNQRLEAVKAKQELEQQKQKQELVDLRNKQETTERELQIAQLQKDNKERALENADLETKVLLGRIWLVVIMSILFVGALVGGFVFYRYRSQKIHEMQRLAWEKQQRILQEQQQREVLAKEALQAEIKAIKAQMNPHFIFNSLNSIQHFIFVGDKKLANHYLGQFSKLMRMVLEMSNQVLVSLQKELDLLILYIELEALRIENVQTHIEISDEIDTDNVFLTSMLVQPYIENVFKHGLRNKAGEKHIWLRVVWQKQDDVLRIEIEDNGVGRVAAGQFKDRESNKHRSFSAAANERRLRLLHAQQIDQPVEIIDKKNPDGSPAGTIVVLFIPVSIDVEG